MKKFTFEHVVLLPKDQIGLHKQSCWELSYIVRWEGIRTIGDTKEKFQAGEMVLVAPGMQHQWHFNTPTDSKDGMIENITITFLSSLLSNLSSVYEEMEDMVLWYDSLNKSIQLPKESNQKMKDIMWKMMEQDDCERFLSLLRLLVMIWKTDSKRQVGNFQTDRDTGVVNKVVTYLHCNFKRQITIKQLANYIGMNGTSLCSLFKRKKGKTIIQYLLEYRMMMVKEALNRGDASISQICYECGFGDVPYFNRTFKKYMGITPKEYKQLVSFKKGSDDPCRPLR